MANDAQVKLLKEKGVEVWNEWRKANLFHMPNLSRVDLRGAKLRAAKLFGTDLSGADLRGADLSGASFSGADMSGANLSEAGLEEAYLGDADLSGADLSKAKLSGASLVAGRITRANLSGAKLSSVDLWLADLRDSDLSYASVERAGFQEANLSGANLTGASLRDAVLAGVELTNTDFSNCIMVGTQLGNVDLSRSKGLETITHIGPSTIGIDTIYRSGGNIPERFLRGAGVPEPFIVQMKSLVAAMSPIEFYSCFISYSSKDQEFAERLHADLQGKGVRCWFAPEDLKIGDRLRPSFDEAIRVHDKLMVLLSEHSVKSPWVEKEVETAFEKERQQNRTVLFPIRLDEAVMETKEAWAADIRRTRHIGDFRNWKDHDSYKKAFDRLLRDLKAEDKATHA